MLDAVATDGCTVVKVKVAEPGQSFADDVARVAAVRAALDDAGAESGRIRVDVNAAWSVEEAAQRLPVLDDLAGGLEYAEQPCATIADLAALRERGTGVRIAVDEGVRLAGELDDDARRADPRRGRRPRAQGDPARRRTPIPRPRAARRPAGHGERRARLHGRARRRASRWPARSSEPPYACGFGTGRLLADDLTAETAVPVDGRLSVVRHDPDPDRLAAARARVPAERAAWWHARLERAPRRSSRKAQPMNPSTAMARVIVDELVSGGVSEVVLAPGSRSAALAIALAEADARGDLRLHVRVDERSAGFVALGLAKVSREPVVVVTTSGTAVANLAPAMVEASYAGVPIIALTADRPAELRDTGANQTIDQARFFDGTVRWQHDIAVAEARVGQVRYWRSVVARAVAVSIESGRPGPVHLNVAFRDPLVPDADETLGRAARPRRRSAPTPTSACPSPPTRASR